MPGPTRQQAESYLNKFSPEQQEEIRNSWGGQDLLLEWFTNAVNAGDPGAVKAAGGEDRFHGTYGQAAGGYDEDYGAKKLPKPGPNPTPDEIRRYSWDQGWGTDDYGDITNGQIQQWINEGKWDAQAGRFKNDYGDFVDKPWDDGPKSAGRQAEFNKGTYASPDDVRVPPGGFGGGAGGGQGGGGPYQPPEPVTHGQTLSYTGDPMVDMLLYQFNTKASLDGRNKNIFGLGEDRRPGGEGENEDLQDTTGQLLAGGGLWWSGDESAFSGFGQPPKKENKKKPGGAPSPQTIASPPPETPQPSTSAPGTGGPPDPEDIISNLPSGIPDWKRNQIEDMLRNQYSGGTGGPEPQY